MEDTDSANAVVLLAELEGQQILFDETDTTGRDRFRLKSRHLQKLGDKIDAGDGRSGSESDREMAGPTAELEDMLAAYGWEQSLREQRKAPANMLKVLRVGRPKDAHRTRVSLRWRTG